MRRTRAPNRSRKHTSPEIGIQPIQSNSELTLNAQATQTPLTFRRRALFPQALTQVAAQLEMPFGQDDNDLPLEHFQKAGRGCVKSTTFLVKQHGTKGNESKLAPADARARGLRCLLHVLESSEQSGFLFSC